MVSADDEIPLSGGTANAGAVVRVGNTVRRPATPQSPAVLGFLAHLHDAAGRSPAIDRARVPEPLGFDDHGREQLRWIDGVVPEPPYDDWTFAEDLLADVAATQRQLHELAASFDPPEGTPWASTARDYFPAGAEGALTCHNDLCMSNIVVADGRVAGVIDFEYVKPVDRLFDIAVAARHWAPLGVPIPSDGIPDLDRVRRFGIIAEVHALTADERRRVAELAIAFLATAFDNVAALAASGRTGFQRLLDSGYAASNTASREWIRTNLDALSR